MKKPLMIAGGAVGIVVLAIVALVVIQLLRSDDPNLATEAPEIPTRSAETPSAAASASPEATSAGGATVQLPEGVRRFVIVPAESSAKYVVNETLRGLDTTAVGTTSAISGEIYLTPNGLWDGAESKFQVDISTLKSDESMRDRYIRDNTLQANKYPNAVYVIESVDGFPAAYTEGDQVQLSIRGTMTIHDRQQTMTFTVLARQAGDTLTATADADFNMTDFGITPPNVQIAKAKDGVHIQVVLVAQEPA